MSGADAAVTWAAWKANRAFLMEHPEAEAPFVREWYTAGIGHSTPGVLQQNSEIGEPDAWRVTHQS